MNENHAIYACKEHIDAHVQDLTEELERDEIITITIRHARAKQCMFKGCGNDGNYLIAVQFFEQVTRKVLK